MNRRHVLAAIAVPLSASLALTACDANPSTGASGGSSTGAATRGGTLQILQNTSSVILDPAKSQSLAITLSGLLYRRLTAWDIRPGRPPAVVPDLATDTGASSDGGRTWTFHLKPGLTFDDGTPITSADIKYGVERSFAPELSGGLGYHKTLLAGGPAYRGPYTGGELTSIRTPDARTIVFQLAVPYGDWPWLVSMPAFTPVPRARDTAPQTYAQHPAASGPYQVESYRQGTALRLIRNPHWSGATDPVRTGGPDRIVVQLGQDKAVTAQRLIADSGDDRNAFGASFVPAAQLVQAGRDPGAKQRLVTSDPGALAYLAVNTRRPLLQDVRVRQAIEYAVDKHAYQIASGGEIAGGLATTLITPGIPGRVPYDLYPAPPTGDVTKAKQLLAAAGHPTLSLKLLVNTDSTSTAQAQAIQQGLLRAGIATTLAPLDDDAATAVVSGPTGDYDLVVRSWQPDFPSANGNIQPLFATSEIGNGGSNASRYSQPEVDALIARATAEIDPVKAQAIWAQADRRIMQDAPVVPLIYTRNTFLHGSNVENFFVSSFPAYPNYLRVTLARR